MKKVLIALLVVGLMASISMAAKAPVAKAVTSSSSGMRIGLGSYVFGGVPNVTAGLGIEMLRFSTDTFNGAIGAGMASINAANNTNSYIAVAGLFTFNLTGGRTPTHAGGALLFQSVPGGSVFTLGALWGAESSLNDNLIVGFDIIPVSFASSSVNNATVTTFNLGNAAVYATYLF